MEAAVERYIAARTEEERIDALSDAAFARYFAKVQAGEKANGAAASRLSNLANYASTETYAAESVLYDLDLDPDKIWNDRK